MKRMIATGAVALAAISGEAIANEPLPAFRWSGAYFGADAGYSFGRLRYSIPSALSGYSSPRPSGVSLGAHAGYRHHFQNNIIVGGEVRAFVNVSTRDEAPIAIVPPGVVRAENAWGGDARVSLGYAFGQFLPYIAGGLALAGVDVCLSAVSGGTCLQDTRFVGPLAGWTVGTGLNYALDDRVLVRFDYSYSRFEPKSYRIEPDLGGLARLRFRTHALRLSVGYGF